MLAFPRSTLVVLLCTMRMPTSRYVFVVTQDNDPRKNYFMSPVGVRDCQVCQDNGDGPTSIMCKLDGCDLLSFLDFFAVEIPEAANTLRYYAGAADKIHAYTLAEPIGMVGTIIPWNYPTTMFFIKVRPALAAGCTIVIKPAEKTPLSALFYVHLPKSAGIPDGVLNMITGFGPTASATITSHMDIDMVSFTGFGEVGCEVMKASKNINLKQVSLELGGKSPILIFDDVDVDTTYELALFSFLCNKEGIYDELVKKLEEKAKAWVEQFDKILSYIDHGKREGATLLTGGKPIGQNDSYYIKPTIFTDSKEDMLIVKDEIFGPVLSLMKFKMLVYLKYCFLGLGFPLGMNFFHRKS
ncbi:hypothetical protein UlMin_011464 [Ulmus minor]